jgi:uncharacterized membrane protein
MPPSDTPPPTQRRETTVTMSYEGILPPPSMLRAYNDVVPGAADRIISMAERQSAHRQSLEKAVVDGNLASEQRGQTYGLIIGLVVAIGSFILVAYGHSVVGITALIVEIVALVTVFVVGRFRQEAERAKKREETAVSDETPFE